MIFLLDRVLGVEAGMMKLRTVSSTQDTRLWLVKLLISGKKSVLEMNRGDRKVKRLGVDV